jgi:hypothetical protein
MNPIWFEIPSVIVVLVFVGVVVIRAFTAPVSPEGDRVDIFMRRQLPGASAAQRTQKTRGR